MSGSLGAGLGLDLNEGRWRRLLGSVVLLRGAREGKKKAQSKPPHGSSLLQREAELEAGGGEDEQGEDLWRFGLGCWVGETTGAR